MLRDVVVNNKPLLLRVYRLVFHLLRVVYKHLRLVVADGLRDTLAALVVALLLRTLLH